MIAETLIALVVVQAAPSLASLNVEKAQQVAEIDAGKLKGDPARLAWSPDKSSFYLLMLERKREGAVEYHYLIPASGGAPKKIDAVPDWASQYWAWKSGQAAPGQADFKIESSQEQRTERATAAPMGGSAARGGPTSLNAGGGEGASLGDVTAAAAQSQQVNVIILRLAGEVVGEFINGPLVPGLTYGWSPKTFGVIAYAAKDGKLVVMDKTGSKKVVPDADNTLLPAWSDDGSRLAFLERDGRRKYKLRVANVVN